MRCLGCGLTIPHHVCWESSTTVYKNGRFASLGWDEDWAVTAFENMYYGGFARELGPRAVYEHLQIGPLIRPACSDADYAFVPGYPYEWTLFAREKPVDNDHHSC